MQSVISRASMYPFSSRSSSCADQREQLSPAASRRRPSRSAAATACTPSWRARAPDSSLRARSPDGRPEARAPDMPQRACDAPVRRRALRDSRHETGRRPRTGRCARSCGTRMWPISGCIRPCTTRPCDHRAAADSGADRQVEEIGEAARGAPSRFAERRAVHVGVEADRQVEALANGAREVEIAPARLRRRRDVAVRPRIRVQVDRSERRDADGPQLRPCASGKTRSRRRSSPPERWSGSERSRDRRGRCRSRTRTWCRPLRSRRTCSPSNRAKLDRLLEGRHRILARVRTRARRSRRISGRRSPARWCASAVPGVSSSSCRPGTPPVWKWPMYWMFCADGADDVALHDLHVVDVVQQFDARRIDRLHHVHAPSGVVTHVIFVVDLAVEQLQDDGDAVVLGELRRRASGRRCSSAFPTSSDMPARLPEKVITLGTLASAAAHDDPLLDLGFEAVVALRCDSSRPGCAPSPDVTVGDEAVLADGRPVGGLDQVDAAEPDLGGLAAEILQRNLAVAPARGGLFQAARRARPERSGSRRRPARARRWFSGRIGES